MGLQLHRKLTHLSYLLGLLFLSSNINALDISIDGILDEKEWSEAREWTKYYESMPFSLAEPKHFQKVLIQEDEKGMYFGFINLQSKDSIRANKHERDDEMANADKCGLAIDFDGDGLTAYGFTVSAGGSISDGIYRNENDVNYDWDGTTELKKLKPAKFNFKADTDTTVQGFLAHEVSSIVPEAIAGDKDAEDTDSNPIYQGIDQSKLVPLLVKSLQEALTEIDTLKTKVAALEGE